MGLPLFVAPVESDLPSKTAEKSRATSPARSSIRHHTRPDSRGRRSLARRHAALNDRMNALRQTLGRDLPPLPSNSSVDRDMPALPWLSRRAQDNDVPDGQNPSRPRPFREVLREMARSDEQRRDRTGLDSIFGITWQDEEDASRADNDRSEMDLGWWGHESRLARNRNTTTQPSRSESASRSSQRVTFESLLADRRRRRGERLLLRETASARSDLEEQQRLLRIHSLNRPREVNGLGDRDRSLSPEVWDTLLTTLTPDPQPPSAGSSFASIAASQNAGASSGTSLTTPDTVNEAYLVDPGCDSGCDNSDTEAAPYASAYLNRPQRRDWPRRDPARAPRVVYMPADGPVRTSSNDRGTNSDPTLSSSRQQRSPEDLMVAAALDGEGSVSLSRWRRPRHGWVGQLSVGNSDDEQGVDRRSLNREGSTVSANLTSQGDDDWSGMQRIVRSLARREDIPDEWWTEAGLIRTLPQDGTE